ncbi:hypothetical protein F2P81_003122 [Scophthalmus maximus]|uniref:Uncharacterized protein n=1 Tax=Scophthalmus maximus TaxID=52904 RepID=A0A6A4TL89_SCOMX|nr:hypothetical protein F2P81_003122 [Scophthalmus maximus]
MHVGTSLKLFYNQGARLTDDMMKHNRGAKPPRREWKRFSSPKERGRVQSRVRANWMRTPFAKTLQELRKNKNAKREAQ